MQFGHPQRPSTVRQSMQLVQRQHIGLEHETPDKGGGWPADELLRVGALVPAPLTEHGDLITDGQRLPWIVGDQNRSHIAGRQHRRQLGPQAMAHLHIQVGEGLIQKQQLRPGSQGPHQGESLTLAT